MKESVIKRIKKLLALSESNNLNEASNALLKAQELLVKNNLTMKDISCVDNKIVEHMTDITFTKSKWKAHLAEVISNNFKCYCYCKTHKTNIIFLFGREEDVNICNIVLNYAIDCIINTVKKEKYVYRKQGLSTKGLESNYALGFIKGLFYKFEKQRRENQEWGLVLVKDKEVVDEYNNLEFGGSVSIATDLNNEEMYLKGYSDGKNFSIDNKISESKNEK